MVDSGWWALTVNSPLHDWSRADLLTLAGVAATVVTAAFPPFRRAVLRGWWAAAVWAGWPQRRYARWFAQTWGVYDNPYLQEQEWLDLGSTYVPLSIRRRTGPGAGTQTLTIATAVLADEAAGNLVILGDPGSGKSTLLKAYGVGVLGGRGVVHAGVARGHRPVPFLVQLRKLARGDGPVSIADYLASQVLQTGAGMSKTGAGLFLRYTLRWNRAVVMLDGLDELPAHRRPAVLEAVADFSGDHSRGHPSYRARLMITCRQQNFESLGDEQLSWLAAVGGQECWLESLGDTDIHSYLDKHRTALRPASPDSFFEAIRASGTLDLHRFPLILAMSVGLYAARAGSPMPSSIAGFYQRMVRDMLGRRGIRLDPGGAIPLRFETSAKERFLRRFALRAGPSGPGSGEFTLSDLVRSAALAGDAAAANDPRGFVTEIIEHSGLLSSVGEDGRYVLAHRSIHEFLAAEGLRESGGDASILLARARDPAWQQVILFYAAGLGVGEADAFLPALAARSPELAAHCLARTAVGDAAAAAVLAALRPASTADLTALVAAAMSPSEPVRRMATDRLRREVSGGDGPVRLAGGSAGSLIPLLGAVAEAGVGEIGWLVPWILQQVPDDPRLVAPLWECLAAPGIESMDVCRDILGRLLGLAASPAGFAELARQPPRTPGFFTGDARRRAYPFRKGLPPGHNLVTLLVWADHLGVISAQPNRYLQAKAAGCLDRVETARPQAVSFEPFWAVRIFSAGFCAAAVIAAAVVAVTDGSALVHRFGWYRLVVTVIFGAGLLIAVFGGFIILAGITAPSGSRLEEFLGADITDMSGSDVVDWGNEEDNEEEAFAPLALDGTSEWRAAAAFLLMLAIPVAVAVAALPLALAAHTDVRYFIANGVAGLVYWFPILDGFCRGRRYYLYRPTPYVDLYDDPRSRHWVTPSEE